MKKIPLSVLRTTNFPRMSLDKFFEMGGKLLHETPNRAALDEHLKKFVVPDKDRKCIRCGAYDYGFSWGITHGEGNCTRCGWPARAYHYASKEENCTINTILQYHPDEVQKRAS